MYTVGHINNLYFREDIKLWTLVLHASRLAQR